MIGCIAVGQCCWTLIHTASQAIDQSTASACLAPRSYPKKQNACRTTHQLLSRTLLNQSRYFSRGITVIGVWMELLLPHIANGRPDLYTSLHVLLHWPEALIEIDIFYLSWVSTRWICFRLSPFQARRPIWREHRTLERREDLITLWMPVRDFIFVGLSKDFSITHHFTYTVVHLAVHRCQRHRMCLGHRLNETKVAIFSQVN